MVNPNTINDMTLVNVKAQAKMNQLVQKIGKGKRKIKVTLGKSTRSYLTKLIEEMQEKGIISPYQENEGRKVLVPSDMMVEFKRLENNK